MKNIWHFYMGTLVLVSKGSKAYYCWVLFLLGLMAVGAVAYVQQLNEGLIVTGDFTSPTSRFWSGSRRRRSCW